MAEESVQAGDPLQIEARIWNRLVSLLGARGQLGAERLPSPVTGADVIRVRNDTGSALSAYHVVGVGAPEITPTLNLEQFQRSLIFSGGAPASGAFAVVLEPIPAGEIGRAVVSGVVPVQLDVSAAADSAGHVRAEADAGDATALDLAQSGSARVLWRESGSGTKWALVRLSDVPGGTSAAWESGPFGSWTYAPSAGSSPASGEFSFDNVDSTLATTMYVHVTNDEGEDMTYWLSRAFGVRAAFPGSYTPSPLLEFFAAKVDSVSIAASVATLGLNASGIKNNDSLDANAGFILTFDWSPCTQKGDIFTFDSASGVNHKTVGVTDNGIIRSNSSDTIGWEWTKISSLTEEASPGAGDWIFGEDAAGNHRKYDVGNLPAGEANTASNVGGFTGLFKQKTGVDLEFKSVQSSDGSISVTGNASDVDLSTVGTATGGWVQGTTVNFGDLTGGATTDDLSVYTLPAKGTILFVAIKHVQFVGDSGTALTSIGIGGDNARYYNPPPPGFDLEQATGDTAGDMKVADTADPAAAQTIDSTSGTTDVRAYFSTDTDFANLTAGSVEFWFYVAVRP